MNRRTAINSAVIAAAAAATASIASAADAQIEVFVDHWKKSKDFTLKVAQAMPAENYDYKPFADARPFGGELQHLGQADEAMIHTAHTRGYAEMYLRNKGIVPPEYDV